MGLGWCLAFGWWNVAVGLRGKRRWGLWWVIGLPGVGRRPDGGWAAGVGWSVGTLKAVAFAGATGIETPTLSCITLSIVLSCHYFVAAVLVITLLVVISCALSVRHASSTTSGTCPFPMAWCLSTQSAIPSSTRKTGGLIFSQGVLPVSSGRSDSDSHQGFSHPRSSELGAVPPDETIQLTHPFRRRLFSEAYQLR